MNSKRLINKTLALMLSAAMTICLAGCGKEEESSPEEPVDVLLITDYGTVSDGTFNQGIWEGIEKYSQETGDKCAYYQPEDTTTESYMEQIKRGVKNGAKVIICPGYMLEETVYDAQSKYSDVKFILIDGTPHNSDYSDETIADNTESIVFAEEMAGFLAGYSVVRDGYKGLGFMGGIAEDPVIRYGYGFVQGADYAAIEMGVDVHIRYVYTNTFSEDGVVEVMAGSWYDDDTRVIFACGGSMCDSVIRAAETHDGKVIGVDVDQSDDSETIITSAMKSLDTACYNALMDYHNGSFKGGMQVTLDAAADGVCLPMDTSRFDKFTKEQYESVLDRLKDGMIVPYNGTDIGTTQELTLVNTTVTYINM